MFHECQQEFVLHLHLQVIAIAKELGQRAVGYELNPWLVAYSRLRAWWAGESHRTEFYVKDMWKVPQSNAHQLTKMEACSLFIILTMQSAVDNSDSLC